MAPPFFSYAFVNDDISFAGPPTGPFKNDFDIKKFLDKGFYNSYNQDVTFLEDYITLDDSELNLPENYLIFRMQQGNSSSPIVNETSKGHTIVNYLIFDLGDNKNFNLSFGRNGTSAKYKFSTSDKLNSYYISYNSSFSLDIDSGNWLPNSSINHYPINAQKFIEMPMDTSKQYISALVYSNVKDLKINYDNEDFDVPDKNPKDDGDSSFDSLSYGELKKVSPNTIVCKNGKPSVVEFTYNFKMSISLKHVNSLSFDIPKYSRMITDSLLIELNGVPIAPSDISNVSVSYTQDLYDPDVMQNMIKNNTLYGTLKFSIPSSKFRDLSNIISVNTNCYTEIDQFHTPLESLTCSPNYINLSNTSEVAFRDHVDIDNDGKDDNTGDIITPGDNFLDDIDKPPAFPTMPDTLNPVDWVLWLIDVILWFIKTVLYYILAIIKALVNGVNDVANALGDIPNSISRMFSFVPSPFPQLLITGLSISFIIGVYKLLNR